MPYKLSTSLLILTFISHAVFSQHAAAVKGVGYKGFIFDSAHIVFKSVKGGMKRYAPSAADIDIVESVLKKQLSVANEKKINQVAGCPVIHRNLKKYYRQYVGFINSQGQKVIWINLFWNKDLVENAKKDIVVVNDGCSYYWDVEINITTRQLSHLQINGIG